MTLRTRFALWVGVVMLVALCGFGTVVYLTVSGWLAASVDESLRLSAAQLIATSDLDHGRIDLPDNPVTLDPRVTDELRSQGFTIQVFNADGRLVQAFGPFASLTLEPADSAAAEAGRTSLSTRPGPDGAVPVRVYSQGIPVTGGVVVVQVSQSLRGIEAIRRTLLTALLLGSPVLVAVAGVGGFFLARGALAPIDEITRAARRISAESLSGRLDLPASRDEIGRLAATFDDMLARLEDAFQRERRFTHDAAHELRTPLAAMQTILSVIAARRRTVEDYETALADIAEETARLNGLTEDLLRLARADLPADLTEDVDMSVLLGDVAGTLEPVARAKGLTLDCAATPRLWIRGDTDALIRMVLNLIDNAIKFTRVGGVTVRGTTRGDAVVVEVTDTGEGIDSRHLPHVFERFYRADEARTTPGTGLGLAISSDIAHAHGGSITVASVKEKGTTFTVTLPRATGHEE